MYAWKCWRESRSRVITYLMVLVSTAVLFAYLAATLPRGSGGNALKVPDAEFWRATLMSLGSIIVAFAGLGLGASGVGEEFEQGTVEFLLTRPRRRRSFVWTAWATGAAALFIMVGLAVLASLVTLMYVMKSAGTWRLLTVTVPWFVFGTVVYSLTYCMTALLKNGRAALSLSLGLIVLSLLLPVALKLPWVIDLLHWRIDLPSPVDVLVASKWATVPGAHFPVIVILGWSLVALAFPLATQFLFERAEV